MYKIDFLKNSMDLESDIINTSNIDAEAEVSENEMASIDKVEEGTDALELAITISKISTESDEVDRVAAIAFAKAVAIASVKLDADLESFGLNSSDVKNADIEAAKDIIKKIIADGAKMIASIAKISKKLFLKASAWMAKNDKRVKELIKKIEKLKTDGKEVKFKDDDARDKVANEFKGFNAMIIASTDDGYSLDALENTSENIKVAEYPSPILGTDVIDKVKGFLSDLNVNTFTENLINASGTKAIIIGVAGDSLIYLVSNDAFVDKDSSNDDDEAIAVYKVIKYNLADNTDDVESVRREFVKGSIEVSGDGFDDVITGLKALPKAKDVQKAITESFKALDKNEKAVAKRFEKDPSEWEEKAAKAKAIKDSYVAGSKVAFSSVKYMIDGYRFALKSSEKVLELAKKKSN